MAMHFIFHSPHVACHVITLLHLCDYDVTHNMTIL